MENVPGGAYWRDLKKEPGSEFERWTALCAGRRFSCVLRATITSSGYFAKCFSEAPRGKATSKNFPDHEEASVFPPALAQSWAAWV